MAVVAFLDNKDTLFVKINMSYYMVRMAEWSKALRSGRSLQL